MGREKRLGGAKASGSVEGSRALGFRTESGLLWPRRPCAEWRPVHLQSRATIAAMTLRGAPEDFRPNARFHFHPAFGEAGRGIDPPEPGDR